MVEQHLTQRDPSRPMFELLMAYLLFLTRVICLDAHPVQLLGFEG